MTGCTSRTKRTDTPFPYSTRVLYAFLLLERGKPVPAPICWWSPDFSNRIRASEGEAAKHLIHLMRAAVTDRMVADVPLGAFLSGGVDSSAVVALMAEASAKRSEEHTSELQ